MMAKDPSARPSAQEVAARLKAIREDESQERGRLTVKTARKAWTNSQRWRARGARSRWAEFLVEQRRARESQPKVI